MYCVADSLCYSQVVYLAILASVLGSSIIQVECLNISYPKFTRENSSDFIITGLSSIALDAIQVTLEQRGASIRHLSGRVWYKEPFKLYSRRKNITASFNSTFVLNILPQSHPGGEGLAFILTKESGETYIPDDSEGQWLGIVNANVYSIKQVSLNGHGIFLSSGIDVTVSVQYNGESKNLTVSVFMTNETRDHMKKPILAMNLDLTSHLPEDVFVGFSASTGENTQLNCIRSWNFTNTEIDDNAVKLLWVWISISVVPVVLLTGLFLYLHLKRKLKGKNGDPKVELQIQSSATAPQKFRLKELKQATGNFNSKNQLGKGGFGTVYKGLLNNEEVAVKRFSNHSHGGKQDFIAEVTIIGNLHHKNLVKLVGWCNERNELILVYELMPNGSLDKLIFCNNNQDTASTLNWDRRHGIICGVAQALDYLHNGSEKAHYSTKEIAGTPGYMAPESFHIGRATIETDVYAFGVLLLEVVSGRKPGNQNGQNNYNNRIVDWVWELYGMERVIDAVDNRLNRKFEEDQAECVLKLGLACCHPNPYKRPSMRTALQVLVGEAAPTPVPSEKPVFMWPAATPSFKENLDYSDLGGQLTQITELIGR
ncbi:hypothetical protein F0562_015841 [Nyssa sinensis]|uniref:Protein kinase domain-containing protein n=1 Tax=Nyssa sinensis TaxID=561372 RepID=A0A5J4ZKX0_9ASTE|nr:hypothetical protein F0562_015841 [Nyssa sinensis]